MTEYPSVDGGTAGTPGVVTGRPPTWLQIEGLAVAGTARVLFATTGCPLVADPGTVPGPRPVLARLSRPSVLSGPVRPSTTTPTGSADVEASIDSWRGNSDIAPARQRGWYLARERS